MNNIKEELIGFDVKPNPDPETFKDISDAIRQNNNYCCCAITKEPDTMCMCKEFRDQNESGFCHCGRFYKVKKFSTIAILSTPEDDEHATYLAQSLTSQGFIVHAPMYGDMITFLTREELFNELQKVKIQKADIVLVVNTSQKAVESLAEQIYWAEELQKKIIYEHNEEVKEDEA